MAKDTTAEAAETLSIDGQEIRVTHPNKPYFTKQAVLTKLDLVRYYLAVAPGALNGIRDRPVVLKRFVNGAEAEPFYQKRTPSDRPAWLRTTTLSFPSGRTAEEVVVDNHAGLAWIVNLGCIELHPHPVRTGHLDHPDELHPAVDVLLGRTFDLEIRRGGDLWHGTQRIHWKLRNRARRRAARGRRRGRLHELLRVLFDQLCESLLEFCRLFRKRCSLARLQERECGLQLFV